MIRIGMEFSYRHPPGVANPPGTCMLVTPHGGAVAVDESIRRLWHAANGRNLTALRHAADVADVGDILPEALACLAEGRLLERCPPVQAVRRAATRSAVPAVAAIVVVSSQAELEWLDACLASLNAQDPPPAEIILVDNGGVTSGVTIPATVPCRVVHRGLGPYAAALNDGTRATDAEYLLLLNADVKLEQSALRFMLEKAGDDPAVAAVAPKLTFWRVPGFLNGLGNRVRERDWGTDNGIGQLDLGQFDHWTDVPSGCFAALLVSKRALRNVGEFDAGYPAYYEDADWAYRARAMGYRIAAAPEAEVSHVFSASWTAPDEAMSAAKQSRAGAGRLRFAWKIPGRRLQWRMLGRNALEDLRNAFRLGKAGHHRMSWAHARGVLLFTAGLPSAMRQRLDIQRRRRVGDAVLFPSEHTMPASAMAGSKPLLTSSLIREYYAPLIRSGRTRALPECA